MNGLPRDWLPTLIGFLDREPVAVRIVVAEVRGSTPREPGAFMLVGRDAVEGSIGGGQLEWEAIAGARELLDDTTVSARVDRVVLSADVGQCCGGVVSVWLERFTTESLSLLRAAADAGARGSAVLSSTIAGGNVERRIVRGPGTGIGRETRDGPVTAGVSLVRELQSGPAAAISSIAGPPVSTGARAAAPSAAAISSDVVTDHLLHEPRQRAHPLLTRDAAGNFTFLERLDDEFPAVWLYGAGHVGQALARILVELPLRLTWIDSRADLFPPALAPANSGVRILHDPDTVATVSEAPVGACFIVMSHSHPLDFALCHALLERNDFAWLGLIGSMSKAARFRSRLTRAGLGPDIIRKLACPIGVAGIDSKWPAAIAVAVAAQLMQQISASRPRPAPQVESARADMARVAAAHSEPAASHLSRAPTAQAPTERAPTAPADPTCSPENCATCGSAAPRPRTVTS